MYALRMMIAFAGTAFFPYLIDRQILTIPLTLGVVAAGISNIDDRFSVHLRNLFYTYIGFFVAASSVQLLFPHPVLFAVGLIVSCIVFILLGSLGPRYATISYGSLVVGVYAMLGVHLFDSWYEQPLYLVAGAAWYGFLTSISDLVFPVRKLDDHLSACYNKLGAFLYAKSNLFDADLDAQEFDQALIDLSLCNSKLVATLNSTRISLLTRLKGDRGQKDTRRNLQYYFVAQDIHERGDSAHIDYQTLAREFRYSDILFRFQRLLSTQSRACMELAKCIRLHRPYKHNPRFARAFERLKQSIQSQYEQGRNPIYLNALSLILTNLKEIDAQLANMETERSFLQKNFDRNDINQQLRDDSLQGFTDIWQRIRQNLSPESVLFRHAIRLSLVLLLAYVFIQLTHLEYGYWILLTALFVSQPNFNATQRRLKLRISGTLAGVLIGLPILYFVPSVEGQLVVLIIAGVLFFELRSRQYAQATAFITLLALINFNLDGSGFDAALPRITDTILGCFFAWLGVSFIWPDWKFRRLPRLVNRALTAQCDYLAAVVRHYHDGKSNDMDYRIKRRAAHNTDAELASFISTLATEPDQDAIQVSQCFRFLCLSHTFLSYISALGAHRAKLEDHEVLTLLDQVLDNIQGALLHAQMPKPALQQTTELLTLRLQNMSAQAGSREQLVLQQIRLLMSVLPEFSTLNQSLSYDDHSDASALAAL
ncbi:TIGR01666 family membrane protein [Alkanindiges hydrocarboniclasticus]|uniref:TIGR01666 family membrane protein n=1 Tax=Alkanindiges hydrocarboniclasticus TaxID=1907941 RepID=A0A1S8CYB7_9GAMM|nr:TIGR01666 family membrane protein [Alkanindiges hydrocarboniclasticus]